MKPTMTVLVCVLAAGMAAAQSPISVIQNTRATMNGVRDHAAAASNAALGIQQKPAPAAAHPPAQSHGTPAVAPGKPAPARPGAARMGGPREPRVGAIHKSPALKSDPTAPKPGAPVAATVAGNSAEAGAGENAKGDDNVPDNRWDGKRDPFISPVVSHAGNSGCSTGKKCLEIAAINLRGIVHSGDGFIAVVSNSLNKAYFLKEHDPVFNGYVVKITGDSIVFQETVQDRLGKTFTREVVKKITTPAV